MDDFIPDSNHMEKKMTSNDAIIRMVRCINDNNHADFYKLAQQYHLSLSKTGSYFHRLAKVLNQKPMEMMRLDQLSSSVKNLFTLSIGTIDTVYVNSELKKTIDELLLEWINKDTYNYHNIPIRTKILLHGPTGNGKTTIARHIAHLSDLPFVEIHADRVIDSHIGSSGKNIHMLFNEIKEPCVLFWDEVDTIGRMRGDRKDDSAAFENERMVNSMLINIEKLGADVIFIGATNRAHVLDAAFLRRFDMQIELADPAEDEKYNFAYKLLSFYKLDELYMPNDIDKYNSFAEIKKAVLDKARTIIAHKIKNEVQNTVNH